MTSDMKLKSYLLIILLFSVLFAGCDNHTNDIQQPEVMQMQDGEFEGLGGNAVADIVVFGQIAGTSAVQYINR